jgi:hypothetical protein
MTSYQQEPGSDDLLDPEARRRLAGIPEPITEDNGYRTRDDEPDTSEQPADPS